MKQQHELGRRDSPAATTKEEKNKLTENVSILYSLYIFLSLSLTLPPPLHFYKSNNNNNNNNNNRLKHPGNNVLGAAGPAYL